MMSAVTSEKLTRFFTIFFVLAFFAYLFGPLIVMGMSAFNTSEFPRISPWDCFTVEWFEVLTKDTDLMTLHHCHISNPDPGCRTGYIHPGVLGPYGQDVQCRL